MPNIGPTELVVVLVLALLILGPKRLPAAGRSIGQGMREFKTSLTGEKADVEDPIEGRRAAAHTRTAFPAVRTPR